MGIDDCRVSLRCVGGSANDVSYRFTIWIKMENPNSFKLGSPSMKKKYEKKIEAISVPKSFFDTEKNLILKYNSYYLCRK